MGVCEICSREITDSQYLLLNSEIYKSCPECSKQAGEHVFYKCPDAFGYTPARSTQNNPKGLQSHCSRCRSKKVGPHDGAITCSQAKRMGGFVISEVRILPMSLEVFGTYFESREFLLNTLPSRGNIYYFMASKMNCEQNSFILFQGGACLIGYAIHESTTVLEKPVELDDGRKYSGYYKFFSNSIYLFEKLIDRDKFREFYPQFKSFNQSHQNIPVAVLPDLFEAIHKNSGFVSPFMYESATEEFEETEIKTMVEGAKKQITVNAYERNPKARKACIDYYKKKNNGIVKCEICGFSFKDVYGIKFYDKIHVHHIVEISAVGEEYEVDAIQDLIPICPNCHLVAHSRKPAYTPEEIQAMMRRTN